MLFPVDVVDHILSFLDTLRQCAQSHPILFKLSERHIYANVILLTRGYAARNSIATSEFIKILSIRPDIAKHVRSLAIHVYREYLLASQHLYAVAYLLPTFKGLINLEIKTSDGCFDWQDFPCTFRQPFLDFLYRQGKKEVSICGARFFPLSLLNACKDVRVTLDRCEYTRYDKGADSKNVYPEPFEHLSILRCSPTCFENIIAWPRIHSLRSLEYKVGWCTEELGDCLPPLMVACSNSLTNFCFDINYYYESFHYDQDVVHSLTSTLASLRHLERFSIKAHVIVPSSGTSPIPVVVALILAALALPSLKELYLEFKYTNYSSVPGSNPGSIWLPFVPVVAECSSLFIPVYISEKFTSVITSCEELIPYVEKGVIVMIPEIPTY